MAIFKKDLFFFFILYIAFINIFFISCFITLLIERGGKRGEAYEGHVLEKQQQQSFLLSIIGFAIISRILLPLHHTAVD